MAEDIATIMSRPRLRKRGDDEVTPTAAAVVALYSLGSLTADYKNVLQSLDFEQVLPPIC